MKYLFSSLLVAALVLATGMGVAAAPFNAENNPQIVANYPTGDHGVAGETATHNGADVVMRAGQSGNFQQWFYGTSTEGGGNTEGDHSVWMLKKGDSCPGGSFEMTVGPNNFWGDYLTEGATYCIKTNDFHQSN